MSVTGEQADGFACLHGTHLRVRGGLSLSLTHRLEGAVDPD